MIRRLASSQFIRFLFTGGLAALVNFGSRIFYNRWMGFSAAVCVAYVTGMITAFLLARWLVFGKGEQSTHRSAAIFLLVNIFAIAQTWAVSILLADYLLPAMGVRRFVLEIAHAVGVMIPVFTSYIGHKRYSFR